MKNRFYLICFVAFLYSSLFTIYAQSLSDSLSGTFELASENGMYNAFIFDGAGRVTVKSLIDDSYDFFQVDDTVVVYPDKDIFRFCKIDDQTFVGISVWIEGQVFKKTEEYPVDSLSLIDNKIHLSNFYSYYKLCDYSAPNLATYLRLASDDQMKQQMHQLCDAGFSKACLTMANAMMIKSPVLISTLLNPSEKKEQVAPDQNVLYYFAKALRQNDPEAFTQLAAYYLLLGDNEKAQQLFTAGCDQGIVRCCVSLAGLEYPESEN